MISKNLSSTISSISVLQGTCNMLEKRLTAKLTKLEVGTDSDDIKVTEATFLEFNGDRDGLGKTVIEKGGDGKNSAYIMSVDTDVRISRS